MIPVRGEHGAWMADKVLEYISDFISREGWAPTVREIGKGVGLRSSSTVQVYLNRLCAEQRLERLAGSSRAMRVL